MTTLEAGAATPVVVVAHEFGGVGALVHLEHDQVLVGVDHVIFPLGTAQKEAFVDGRPVLKNLDGCGGCLCVALELPFEAQLIGCGAVAEEVGVVVVDSGIEFVAQAGVVPAAATSAPVVVVQAGEVFHGACLIGHVAEAGVGDEAVVGVAPGLLAEVGLGVVYVGTRVEHAGMVEGVGLGLVHLVVGLGVGNLPGVDVGPAVLDFGAGGGGESHGSGRV